MDDAESPGLDRFVAAQAAVWPSVCAELRGGRKRTHWIWFVFPQHRALGRSATARFFGLAGRDEAMRYLAHPLLGPRLRECVGGVLAVDGRTPLQILGSPDDLKLCSCLTLFEAAAQPDDRFFGEALDRLYGGRRDPLTLALLA